jgi:hypothetical protein
MLTIVHGGQTGVDRGGHTGALDNGWSLAGYMPLDRRDELGPIPDDVARYLIPSAKSGYAARTVANVYMSTAALIVVPNAEDPRVTPGTTKTLELASDRRLPRQVADPRTSPEVLARWIWHDLMKPQSMLPLGRPDDEAKSIRLLVAGPRESKWQGARAATAGLLRQVAQALAALKR